jgi:L-asparaginase
MNEVNETITPIRRILILATGGTIVCSETEAGLRPHYTVEKLMEFIQPACRQHVIEGKTIMNIDSSNMVPQNWVDIARVIRAEYEKYDGFVITHGTDTMAYTASALTYILQGLSKPIILTGSQYSLIDSRTDAIQNLNDAILFACEELAGVFIAFDGKLINGTRAIKTKTRSYDAFNSVNFPPVAVVKHNRIRYNQAVSDFFAQRPAESLPAPATLSAPTDIEDNIFVLKLFPGLDPKIFDYLKRNVKGVIIESYGIGGISSGILDLSAKVRELTEADLAVVVTTQCLMEGIDLQVYEVGRMLPLDKIIYAKDMNTEAIVPKLMWALGAGKTLSEVKSLVETPVNGDIQENPETYYYF